MSPPMPDLYAPGTRLTVGSHQAQVIKYLTSGGFAHIYTAQIIPQNTNESPRIACLKRVLVPDKQNLNTLRAEVDAMKLLRNEKHVVSYIDSHASKSGHNDGTYEVFLLMEYCARGGLIDFMNTRLRDRLQEHEVLKIMSHVCQGIAAMHALEPPLIHRDIKIENVLISEDDIFKVCDFGSVCGIIRPPKTQQELQYVQHDILKNTTAQYRAPEMIDLYRGFAVNEKSDIWALGIFLYKLCYYTTPFEKTGEVAILHSKFQFLAFPQYSDRMKNLISAMLREDPTNRPNICQVLEEISRMQGVACPIRNFYLVRSMHHYSPPEEIQQQNGYQQQMAMHNSTSQPQLASVPRSTPPASQPNGSLPLRPTKSFTAVPAVMSSISGAPSLPYQGSQLPLSLPAHVHTIANANFDPFQANKNSFLSVAYSQSQKADHHMQPRAQTFNTSYSTNLEPIEPTNSQGVIHAVDLPSIRASNSSTRASPPNYVDSGTQTLDEDVFLRRSASGAISQQSLDSSSSVESLEPQSSGSSLRKTFGKKLKRILTGEGRSVSPIKSRHNTGDSVKSAFSSLRRGLSSGSFTGDPSSRKASNEPSRSLSLSKYRVSSSESIEEEPLTSEALRSIPRREQKNPSIVEDLDRLELENDTEAREYYRSQAKMHITSNKASKDSIQQRVKDLLNSSQTTPLKKTAEGYGKYTISALEGIARQSTNETLVSLSGNSDLSTPKVLSPIVRRPAAVESPLKTKKRTSAKKKPAKPHKPQHLRPNPPKKPAHLRGGLVVKTEQSAVSSDLHADLSYEDLEKDFKRRYPSAV
ncbi:LAMI_0E03972g1_1 [Lachancea mirantina]|uniref:non-specific serine/threonine protein kinase n=1 Tax=Lachancea mirantina TaxID=1230905 RepID=A0A1G4JK53_9SACH|nr:LAMI_0E03972g1_1 [Lachancea mirantina]